MSPKWKNFKGLKLQWRDKIRLNNAIWRAWYMQCKCCVSWGVGVGGLGSKPSRSHYLKALAQGTPEPTLGTLCLKEKPLSGSLQRQETKPNPS